MGEDKLNKYTVVTGNAFDSVEHYSAPWASTSDITVGTSIPIDPTDVGLIDLARERKNTESYWSEVPVGQGLKGYIRDVYTDAEQIIQRPKYTPTAVQPHPEEENVIRDVEELREHLASWYEDYVKNDNKKSIKSRRQPYKPNSKAVKQKISLDEALSAFNDIANKDLGDVILSGSIALAIQGIISRREFKDIDVISFQKFDLDDDMSTYDRMDYPVQQELGQLSSFLYDGYLFDVFIFDPTTKIKTVEVEYNGETYLCQHYSEIIMAKLRMIFPKIKDIDEIKKYIDFNIL